MISDLHVKAGFLKLHHLETSRILYATKPDGEYCHKFPRVIDGEWLLAHVFFFFFTAQGHKTELVC